MIRSSQMLASALLAVGLTAPAAPVIAHGGVFPPAPPPVYLGPGDTVPSSPRGPGVPSAGGPTAPSGPSGPVRASPTGGGPPGPAGPGPTTGGGLSGSRPETGSDPLADPTHWAVWWNLNRAPYLELKRAIHAGSPVTGEDVITLEEARTIYRPAPELVRARVVPALVQVLVEERNNDLVSSAIVALARVAAGTPDLSAEARPHFQRLLRSPNQEIAETAAVALGVLGDAASTETLRLLVLDEPAGRELAGTKEVRERTRAFAAFGLGLIGGRAKNDRTRQEIARHLTGLLGSDAGSSIDLEVAAVLALGLVPVDAAPPGAAPSSLAWSSREGLVRFLFELVANEDRRNLLRAQAPTAIARLVADGPAELRLEAHRSLLALVKDGSKQSNEVQQSVVLALGEIADTDRDRLDLDTRAQLKRLAAGGDEQVRAFALLALGRIYGRAGGGEGNASGEQECRSFLLGELARGRSRLRAWAAIALGVGERAWLESRREGSAEVRSALRAALAGKAGPEELAALAVSVGLCRDPGAKDLLLAKLEATRDDPTRSHLGVALGMIGASEAIAPIEKLVRVSRFRPALLRECATGLGLLGDKTLVPELARELGLAQSQASQASIAQALGAIGDQRALEPLLALLEDEEATDSARGFAAVALGLVCDPEPLPWVARYSVGLNYRASSATLLAGNGTGLLEIL